MNPDHAVHLSCDAIGVSLLAPVGYLSEDALAEQAVTVWAGPGDDPGPDAVTIELVRVDSAAGAAMEVGVHRAGRVARWGDDVAIEVDGLAATGRRFVTDGPDGPRHGVFVVVPVAFPLAIRAEWPATMDRFDEIVAIAGTIRLLTPLDERAGRTSACSVGLRLSAWVPTGWAADIGPDHLLVSGPGSQWRAGRVSAATPDTDAEAVEEDLVGDVHLRRSTGIGILHARAEYLSEHVAITGEGDDLTALVAITRSLRAHPFLGD